MATPPTFIQEAETAWNTTTTPKSTAGFNVQTNDVLVAFMMAENFGNTYGITNSGVALTWTQQQVVSVSTNCWVSIWTTIVDTNRTGMTVTFTRTVGATTMNNGANVLTFRGSDGVGNSSKTNSTGGPSLAITTAASNSAIVTATADFNAVSGTTRTWRTVNSITPTSGNGLEVTFDNSGALSSYVPYGAYYTDAGAAGSQTVGLSAPTGQKFSIVAVEVKGAAGGGGGAVQQTLTLMGVGS